MTVLLSTPYMDEAERCHRVGLMHEGCLLLEGEPRRLIADFDHETFEVEGGERERVDANAGKILAKFAPSRRRARACAS